MNDEEIRKFEKNPNLKEIIAVRFLDEAGKNEDMKTPTFRHFAPMIQRIVDQHILQENDKGIIYNNLLII